MSNVCSIEAGREARLKKSLGKLRREMAVKPEAQAEAYAEQMAISGLAVLFEVNPVKAVAAINKARDLSNGGQND